MRVTGRRSWLGAGSLAPRRCRPHLPPSLTISRRSMSGSALAHWRAAPPPSPPSIAQHGLASPASDQTVTTLLRQARRNATRRRAPPPAAARLIRMATACPGDLAGLRDRALLLLAAAGLGRSALVGLDVEQVHFMEAGVDLVLHSQLGAERTVTVRRVASLGACPVRALKDWIDATDSRFGPVFRKVDRWGNVEHRRLGTDAIRRILTRRTRRRLRRGAAA